MTLNEILLLAVLLPFLPMIWIGGRVLARARRRAWQSAKESR